MPKITREDGVNFIIPSYRDALTAASRKAILTEVTALGKKYGEYLAMQRKSQTQYDVAFAPDSGYLLGETVWQHFNRPKDMIYCESTAGSHEAILVIVKDNNVYLDGSFPLESIQDELVIFLTQQNEFEIFVYGNVPISEQPQEGKFSFDASSVKSFKTLDESAFKSLPLIKTYELKLIETTLREHGIGAVPVRQYLILFAPIGAILFISLIVYIAWPAPKEIQMEPNPYQAYVDAIASPPPEEELTAIVNSLDAIYSAPGWRLVSAKYDTGSVDAIVVSMGNSIEALMQWAKEYNFNVNIRPQGISVIAKTPSKSRPMPKEVYPVKDALAIFIDRLSKVYPGNNIGLEPSGSPTPVVSYLISVRITALSPMALRLIAKQMHDLPLVLEKVDLTSNNNLLEGKITLKVIGN